MFNIMGYFPTTKKLELYIFNGIKHLPFVSSDGELFGDAGNE